MPNAARASFRHDRTRGNEGASGRPTLSLSIAEGAVLVLFAALYAIFIARTTFLYNGQIVGTLFDDALISLRYAYNLHAGFGLVWNPGEGPPVEGYTNPLWTLIASVTFFASSVTTAPIVVSAI